MHLKVIRYPNNVATPGTLIADGVVFSHTLEDIDRGVTADACQLKVQNETCIPYGTYKVALSHSAHFNKVLPEILGVPCFAGVRIHGGNTISDTEGCILIGAESNNVDRISNCAEVLERLIEHMRQVDIGEDITIEITREVA